MSQLDPVQIEALDFCLRKERRRFLSGARAWKIADRSDRVFIPASQGLRRPDDRCDAQHLQARLA